MGTSNSKDLRLFLNDKIGALSVGFDQQFYYPNDEIKGSIWIKTLQNIEVYGCELKLQMQEKWYYKQGKTEYSENNVQFLVNESLPLQDLLVRKGDKFIMPKGNYNIPYRMIIPNFASPSFEFQGFVEDCISMRYVVYCCLLSTQGEKFCLSNLNYLMIRALPKCLNNSLTYSSCINVKAWLLFQKGTCNLNVSYPKTNFKFGDIIPLECNVDNSRSKLNVKHLKVCILQKITFKNIYQTYTCYENEIESNKIYVNCASGTNVTFRTEIKVSNSKLNSSIYKINTIPTWQWLTTSDEIFKFQPSTNSNLIQCEYFVKVSVHFDVFVSYSNRPRVVIPISLTHKAVNEMNNHPIGNSVSAVQNIRNYSSEFEDINAVYPNEFPDYPIFEEQSI